MSWPSWKKSWGNSWGNSWGLTEEQVQEIIYNTGAQVPAKNIRKKIKSLPKPIFTNLGRSMKEREKEFPVIL